MENYNSTKESNVSSYVAVGVFIITSTRDIQFLKRCGIQFTSIQYAINLQAPMEKFTGQGIKMAAIDKMALLTGSSSIYMSIKCALAIADILGQETPAVRKSMDKLVWR